MAQNTINRDEDQLNRSKTELILRLGTYLQPYKLKTFAVICLMLFVMIVGILNPYLLKVAIDTNIKNHDVKGLMIIGAVLIFLNYLAMVASRIRWTMISSVTNNILVNIRHELYTHIQKLSFTFFDNRPVGKILARVMGDISALQNLFNQSIQTLIPELLSLICVTVVMFILNVKLALASVLILPFLAAAMFYIETRARKRWDVYQKNVQT